MNIAVLPKVVRECAPWGVNEQIEKRAFTKKYTHTQYGEKIGLSKQIY